jgi:hypothetical protein
LGSGMIIKLSLLDFDKAEKKHIDLGKMIMTKIMNEVAIEKRIESIENLNGGKRWENKE